jgi:hypothetical protein
MAETKINFKKIGPAETPYSVFMPLSTFILNQLSEIKSFEIYLAESYYYVIKLKMEEKAYSLDLSDYLNNIPPVTQLTTLELKPGEVFIELKKIK